MPHITVDYSPALDGAFDRRAFAGELHPLVVELSASAGVCKTFFRRAAATCVGHREADPDACPNGRTCARRSAFVHIDVGLLPGRPEHVKALVAEAVLDVLAKHLTLQPADEVVCTSEVRDLSASYRLRHLGPAVGSLSG